MAADTYADLEISAPIGYRVMPNEVYKTTIRKDLLPRGEAAAGRQAGADGSHFGEFFSNAGPGDRVVDLGTKPKDIVTRRP